MPVKSSNPDNPDQPPAPNLQIPRCGWNRPWAWTLTALIVVALELGCYFARKYDPEISRENGPMENFQAICLLLGILLLSWTACRTGPGGRRTLAGGLALFYATFLVLEVDVRDWEVRWLTFIFSGWLRNSWLGGAWLVAGFLAWRNLAATWAAFRSWFATFAAALLLVSGCCWVIASLVDKSFLGQKSLFKEELFEVAAAWLMFQSAAIGLREGDGSRRPPVPSGPA